MGRKHLLLSTYCVPGPGSVHVFIYTACNTTPGDQYYGPQFSGKGQEAQKHEMSSLRSCCEDRRDPERTSTCPEGFLVFLREISHHLRKAPLSARDTALQVKGGKELCPSAQGWASHDPGPVGLFRVKAKKDPGSLCNFPLLGSRLGLL